MTPAGVEVLYDAYRRSPDVVKMHIPIPCRFFPAWPTGPMRFGVPGRVPSWRRRYQAPEAIRYLDGI